MKLFLKFYIITSLLIMGGMFIVPHTASAIAYTPIVSFDGSPSGEVKGDTLAKYIIGITKYATGIVGILATVVLMFGGVLWLSAGGSQTQITSAKAWIGASLIGLALSLCSFLLLSTINPALTSFKPLDIQPVKPDAAKAPPTLNLKTACCVVCSQGDCDNSILKCENTTEENCDKEAGEFYEDGCPDGCYLGCCRIKQGFSYICANGKKDSCNAEGNPGQREFLPLKKCSNPTSGICQ